MLTFYHAPRSRSFRILWLLEELGVPYDRKIVSIRRGDGTGESEGPAYRNIHPHAKVPAIIHNGVPIFETPAIALYLTDCFPEAELGPKIGDPLRGPYLTWLAYTTGVFEPALTAKFANMGHKYGAFGWGPFDEVIAHIGNIVSKNQFLLGNKFSAADVVLGGSMPFLITTKLLPDTEPFNSYVGRITARLAYSAAKAKDGK